MRFLSAVYTDVGIKKSTNQDSLLLLEAQTESENVICAVICDGMGGLAKGELASAVVIKELRRWFIEDFSDIYYSGIWIIFYVITYQLVKHNCSCNNTASHSEILIGF